MAEFGSDIEHRRAYLQNVVDLAGMDNSHVRIAHDHHMQVRRRERFSQLIQRLIRQTLHILQLMLFRKPLHLGEPTAAADEAKLDGLGYWLLVISYWF